MKQFSTLAVLLAVLLFSFGCSGGSTESETGAIEPPPTAGPDDAGVATDEALMSGGAAEE